MDPFDREDCFLSICSNPTFLGDSIDELEEFFRVHGFWNLDLESLEKTSEVEELLTVSLVVIFILTFKVFWSQYFKGFSSLNSTNVARKNRYF